MTKENDLCSSHNNLVREIGNYKSKDIDNLSEKELEKVTATGNKIAKIKNEMKKYESSNNVTFVFDSDGFCVDTIKGEGYVENEWDNMSEEEYNSRYKPFNDAGYSEDRAPHALKSNGLNVLNSANIGRLYPNNSALDFGKYVRGALTGNWAGAESERNCYAALSTSTGGVIIPDVLSAEILKKIMNKSLIYRAGVPVVAMATNNLSIAKVKNNPTGAFKAELEEADLSDAEFEAVQLKSKTLYSLCKVSLEMLHSAANLSEVLQNAMADAVADAIDKACIYGTDVNGVKGLASYATINKLDATATDYAQFVNAVGKIRKANGNPTVMGINADIDTTLNLLTDSTGQPLNAPKVVDGLTRVISNNLRNDLGSANDESEALVFDPSAIVLGQQVGMRFETSRDFGMKDGSVYLRIYTMLDMALLRPEHIAYISGLK